MIRLSNRRFQKSIEESLINELVCAAINNNQLIDVTGVRGLGKTTALVEFAKRISNYHFNEGIAVITYSHGHHINYLKKECEYNLIFSCRDAIGIRSLPGLNKITNVVIDEHIDRKKIEDLGFKVLTGFYSEANSQI